MWSFRFEHPDMPFRERPAVPGRVWTTDVAFSISTEGIDVGLRVFCASLPYGDADIALMKPGVVAQLADRVGLIDRRKLEPVPWTMEREADLEELLALLRDPRRMLPVVVLTQPDRRRLQVEVSDFVLNSLDLSKKLHGVAHVVRLPWELGFRWSEIVGKPWSVYLGAVRTYMPQLNFERDTPVMHPRTFVEQILFWRCPDDDRIGEAPFTDFLVNRLNGFSAGRRIEWGDRLFLSEARTKHAQLARSSAQDGENWRALYDEEIAALNAKIEELKKEAEEFSDAEMQAREERNYYKDENGKLRFQADSLRAALEEKIGAKPDQAIAIPESYDEMDVWVQTHLAGRLVLHSRALRGISNAEFEDVCLVYKSLVLLAADYRNMRLGHPKAKDSFETKLVELGVKLSGSITKERAGEQGDTYFVRFPTSTAPRRFLESHLRKGAAKDHRYCMGIYFFWDEESSQVIVGWLPSHLDNRLS